MASRYEFEGSKNKSVKENGKMTEDKSRIITILVVDDDPEFRALTERFITSSEFQFLGADSVAQACEILETSPAGVIILDLNMPNQDGFAFLRIRAKSHKLSAIPVLVTSARNDKTSVVDALTGGANGYLLKPFPARALLEKIRKIVSEQIDLKHRFEEGKLPSINIHFPLKIQSVTRDTVTAFTSVRLAKSSEFKVTQTTEAFPFEQLFTAGSISSSDGDGYLTSLYSKQLAPVFQATEEKPGAQKLQKLNDTQFNPWLAIDDDPEYLAWLQVQFKKASVVCNITPSVDESIEMATRLTPVGMIVDLHLYAEGKGIELVRRLRTELHYTGPIIILTAETDKKWPAHALEQGATELLLKSLPSEALLNRILEIEKELRLKPTETKVTKDPPHAKNVVDIQTQIKLTEISLGGITFISKHLIKKTESLLVDGAVLNEIFGENSKTNVHLVMSAVRTMGADPDFQFEAEWINCDVEKLRMWLIQKRNRMKTSA